jgi:hypothetical protein
MTRSKVAFTSTLPRNGRAFVCPQCERLLSVELAGILRPPAAVPMVLILTAAPAAAIPALRASQVGPMQAPRAA